VTILIPHYVLQSIKYIYCVLVRVYMAQILRNLAKIGARRSDAVKLHNPSSARYGFALALFSLDSIVFSRLRILMMYAQDVVEFPGLRVHLGIMGCPTSRHFLVSFICFRLYSGMSHLCYLTQSPLRCFFSHDAP
jgi:hypothetical protein